MIKLYVVYSHLPKIGKQFFPQEIREFNTSLHKRILYLLSSEKGLLLSINKNSFIYELSLNDNYQLINYYKYSEKEIKKLVMLLDF